MSLPSSALAPLNGADWPMTTLRAVTPGACACAAPAQTATTLAMSEIDLTLRGMPILLFLLSGALDLSQGSRYPDSPTIRPSSANERDDHAVGHRNRAGRQTTAHRRGRPREAGHRGRAPRALRALQGEDLAQVPRFAEGQEGRQAGAGHGDDADPGGRWQHHPPPRPRRRPPPHRQEGDHLSPLA